MPFAVLMAISSAACASACGGGESPVGDAGAGPEVEIFDAGVSDVGGRADASVEDSGGRFEFKPSIAKMIKDTSHSYRMIMAHRGGGGETPENTMAAFEHAVAIPVNSIEIDTQLTKDGVIVIMHDDDLDRTTTCTGAVANKTLEELALCEVDIYSYDAFPDHASRHIPTIDEVFEYLKGKTFINLDAKDVGPDLLVPKIREHGLEDQVIYQTGSIEGCQALERDHPDIFCLPVIHTIEDLDVVTGTLASNLVEIGDSAIYTEENMALIHANGLKATMDVMTIYDLVPYRDKLEYMRLGADMFQSDLPTQWKRVVDTLNRH
ncbi:MAG: glycerophosphodiester phosphodiesterase family protein [Deltaproteobacteria bacterium]|nr:glycerophosphodiester phosphodiesterase family protein [Deltaproteobacteria bacterium]